MLHTAGSAVDSVAFLSSFIAAAFSCQSPEFHPAAGVVEGAERRVRKLQGDLQHSAR